MTDQRTITVLTTGRQDWGILRSVCVALAATPSLRLDLVAGGMHLSARYGRTIDLVRADGFDPAGIAWVDDDASAPADEQAGRALSAVGAHLRAVRSDALVLAGDRLETAAAALAATVDRVPIVHLHGGEQTEGAFDDALRHAITKLAHLHLTSDDVYARRVIAMGEDPAAVHVVGAPGLDAAVRPDLADRSMLAAHLGLELVAPVVIVTVHPTTLDADEAGAARAVAAAMDAVPATYVITMPNVDPGGSEVAAIMRAAADRPRRVAVAALGERRYWGLLKIADAMLGNSSSGLIEAPGGPPAGRQRRRPPGRPAAVRQRHRRPGRPDIGRPGPPASHRSGDASGARARRARHGGRPGRRTGRAYHRGMASLAPTAQAADPRSLVTDPTASGRALVILGGGEHATGRRRGGRGRAGAVARGGLQRRRVGRRPARAGDPGRPTDRR